MVKHSMDLLELLRKRGIDGDVDFLREALRVLVDGIMDAEVSKCRRSAPSTANAAQSGSPTATATATAPGIPASAPWSCTFPSLQRVPGAAPKMLDPPVAGHPPTEGAVPGT